MTHGISEQDWIDYLDGGLGAEVRDRIEAHLIGCLACWQLYDELARARAALREGGERLRAGLALSDEGMWAGLHGVFARIGTGAPDPVRARLGELEAVMAPLCGPKTAARAIRAAAVSSPARSLDRVTRDNWEPFLTSLTSIAAVMCGETGAHLVWESGQF